MYECKVKDCGYETESHSQIANHSKWVHKKDEQYVECCFCDEKYQKANVEQHKKRCMCNPENYNECKECNCHIEKHLTFCNSSCSAKYNNRVGKTGFKRVMVDTDGVNPNYKYLVNSGYAPENPDGGNHYRKICFREYEPKCVICGWDISVDVHHIDRTHENNDVKNLIPLCRNHHIMTEMNKYKDEMDKKIQEIVKKKFGAIV